MNIYYPVSKPTWNINNCVARAESECFRQVHRGQVLFAEHKTDNINALVLVMMVLSLMRLAPGAFYFN